MRWNIGLTIAMLIMGAAMVIMYLNQPKFAYVDTIKLQSGFELRNELEKNFKMVQMTRERILDSLELNFQHKAKAAEAADSREKLMTELELLQQQYLLKKQGFEEDNQILMRQYNEQVANQLNQYMQDFGKKNDYSLIHGANGSGVLMYAQEGFDVTEEAIAYVNNRYKGNSK